MSVSVQTAIFMSFGIALSVVAALLVNLLVKSALDTYAQQVADAVRDAVVAQLNEAMLIGSMPETRRAVLAIVPPQIAMMPGEARRYLIAVTNVNGSLRVDVEVEVSRGAITSLAFSTGYTHNATSLGLNVTAACAEGQVDLAEGGARCTQPRYVTVAKR